MMVIKKTDWTFGFSIDLSEVEVLEIPTTLTNLHSFLTLEMLVVQ